MHYRRWQRNGNPRVLVRMKQPDVCSVDGCEHPCIARGWCVKHYHRWLKHGDVTAVAKSGRPGGTPKEPRELAFVCDVCGREFLRERKPGRPLTVCSPECGAERARRSAKKWAQANPERLASQASREPSAKHAYNAAYYEANRDREIQRSLAYARGAGKTAKQARDSARFALSRGAPEAERFTLDEIFKRDGGWCYLCEQDVDRKDATMDHVIPVTKGGPHTRANVKLAHRSCNTRKGNRLPLAA